MIPSTDSTVSFADKLPPKTDVVVIGGGIIGIAIAWNLAKAGIPVTVVEKGRVAGEQSSRNWGWVRQQGRDAAELPIMMESNRIWQTLSRDIDEELGFEQHGVIYVADNQSQFESYHDWTALATEHGLDSRLISAADIKQRLPDLKGNWVGGVVTPSDGRAEPFIVVPAMARECQRRGVKIIENCAARGLIREGGIVSGVTTEAGDIRCTAVVCAGGAWSSSLLRNEKLFFPQLTVRASVARTAPAPDWYRGNMATSKLALRRRQDHGYSLALTDFHEHFINLDSLRYGKAFFAGMIDSWSDTKFRIGDTSPGGLLAAGSWSLDQVTPFEHCRILDPKPGESVINRIRERMQQIIPLMRQVEIVQSWAGMIDATPDIVPVMDHINTLPGLYLASGFSGHGFGIGPAAGRVMADMIQNNTIGHDLNRFRFNRFTDGTTLVLGPSL